MTNYKRAIQPTVETALLKDKTGATSAGSRPPCSPRPMVLQELLEGNRSGNLTLEEEEALDALLAQVDQIGLPKARARYTLSLGEPV